MEYAGVDLLTARNGENEERADATAAWRLQGLHIWARRSFAYHFAAHPPTGQATGEGLAQLSIAEGAECVAWMEGAALQVCPFSCSLGTNNQRAMFIFILSGQLMSTF
jgi:hypothetical protein